MKKKELPQLKLSNQLCFSLYSLGLSVTRLYRPYLEKLGLTYPQYIAMLVLWEKDPVTVNELGDELNLDSGTLSPLLKKLEALEVITRERDPKDERRVIIKLTKKGKDLRNKAEEIPAKMMCSLGLDLDELNKLRDRLNGINQEVKKSLT